MKHIFYLLTIFPIMWEIIIIFLPRKIYDTIQRMKKIKKYDEYSSTQKVLSFMTISYIVWTIIGFMSFQWPMFLLILLISFIPKPHYTLRWLDAIITAILLIFILINAYHLKIDTYQLILNYYKN